MSILTISRDLTIFKSNRKSFKSNRKSICSVSSQILAYEINRQNGSNRDLNPNRDWDLPITADSYILQSMLVYNRLTSLLLVFNLVVHGRQNHY